jgi:hypothetical protein
LYSSHSSAANDSGTIQQKRSCVSAHSSTSGGIGRLTRCTVSSAIARAVAARGRKLARRAGDAAGAEVLVAGRNAALANPAARLVARDAQHALEERVGQLHRAAIVVGAERVGGERRAAEAAVVRGLADEHEHPLVRALGHAAAHHAVRRRDADRHDVDEHVAVEARVELGVAAEIRHAERVAVVRDALHHSAYDVAHGDAGARVSEAQRIEHADHLGAHAHDVAHDAADARRAPSTGSTWLGWL